MTTGFDELTRRAGSMRTRRHVLGLFGRTAAAAMVGGAVLGRRGPGAFAAEDCVVEHPVVPVGADGAISLFTQSGTHLGVDVFGWFSG